MRMLTRKRSGEKSGKKILSILLAFIMIFSVLGMSGSTSLAQSKNGSTIRFGSSREIKDYKYSDISYNYAKLLQYSLYLYDANMCGPNVGSRSLLSWRGNCHTYDKTTYKRKITETQKIPALRSESGDFLYRRMCLSLTLIFFRSQIRAPALPAAFLLFPAQDCGIRQP